MGRSKPSCARDPNYTVSVVLHMPAETPWRDKHQDVTLRGQHENAIVLWRGVVRDMLAALGMGHPAIVVGLLMELCNSFPIEARLAIAKGIIDGQGIEVKFNPDTLEAMVAYKQKFDAITEGGEVKKPSGLVLPGDK